MSSGKQYGKQVEKDHSKQYLVIGIIIVLLVAALIVWDKWPKSPNVDAAQVAEQTFSVNEVNYYYMQTYNETVNMAQMYAQFGMSGGYDSTKSPQDQMYDEESGKTYEAYFRETALSQLQEVAILTDQANKANYALSDEGKASVEQQMKSLEDQIMQATLTRGGSEPYYIKMMFGENMTKSQLKDIITKQTLASDYGKYYTDQLTYEDAKINEYYTENRNKLDSYDYRLFFVDGKADAGVDEEGNPKEATKEQTDASMKTARETADAMAAKVKGGTDFNTAAKEFAKEDAKASYDDPDYSLSRDVLGSEMNGTYTSWIQDSTHKNGDLNVIEETDSGYYVVQFLAREKRDNSYETANVNSILFTAETTETTAEDGTVTKAPNEEQLAAAKAKADALLADWNKVSDKTPEAFLALAPKSEANVKAETIAEAARSTYGKDFDKWAFTPNSAKAGDAVVVASTDSASAVTGYRVVYLTEFGQSRWFNSAETALREADYTTWFDGLKEQYPVTELDGIQHIGVKQST